MSRAMNPGDVSLFSGIVVAVVETYTDEDSAWDRGGVLLKAVDDWNSDPDTYVAFIHASTI